MQKVIKLKNWSYDGAVCLYQNNQVERTTSELKLFSSGLIKISHLGDGISLIIPITFNEHVDKYIDAFKSNPVFDVRGDAHVIFNNDSELNTYRVKKDSYYVIKSVFDYLNQDIIQLIKSDFSWEQKEDFIPYSAELESTEWQELSQKYFPTIFTKFNIILGFTDYYNQEKFYYYVGFTGIKYIFIASENIFADKVFKKDFTVRTVRTFNDKASLNAHLLEHHNVEVYK